MPRFVVNKVQAVLNESGKAARNARIHLLGVAYKKDTSDVRESPALDVLTLLRRLGARLSYSDPLVERVQLDEGELRSQPVLAACRRADCVVLLTDHSTFDYAAIARSSRRIVDTRNAFRAHRMKKITRL